MHDLALITIGDPQTLTGGYRYHLRLAELAPSNGFRIAFCSVPALPLPLQLLAGPRALAAALRLRPAAVLLDSIAAAPLGPALLTRPRRPPFLAVLHQPPGGIDHGPLRSRLQQRLDLLAYRRMDAFVVASRHLAEALSARGVPPERIAVVTPGSERTTPAAPPGDLRRGRRAALLGVANFLERKGIHYLLEALARLPDRTATLHLVGDPRPRSRYGQRLLARIARADLRERVVVHGPVRPDGIAGLYAGADVFVLPSVEEPYGMVYGEALAAGLPIVGFRSGNLPSLVRDGVEGLLAPVGDVDALAVALRRLAEDAALRAALAQGAARAGAALPTWEQTAQSFFATVRATISSGG